MKLLPDLVRRPSSNLGICLVLLTGLAGCGRDDVQVYRVAKDTTPPEAAQPSGLPSGHPDATGMAQPALTYKTPAGWQEIAPSDMRVASFHVQKDSKQADVSVVPLPGLMGRDLENVNRWRSTVGLPSVSEEQLPKLAQPVEIGGQPAHMYEQAGENPGSGDKTRIIVAVQRRDNVAWFFKINGDDQLVAEQKPTFVEFLKSVSFGSTTTTAGGPMSTGDLPPNHPALDAAPLMSAGAAPDAAKPQWQVPANWKEVPGGQFLLAKFVIDAPANAQAAVNVSMSPGEGGGLAMNVNRWRGQLGLSQLSEEEVNKLVTPVDTTAGKAMFVEMTGTDARSGQKARLVAAVVPQGNRTWFYKLMGNEQVVQREKEAFSKFVQTARYPHAL